MGRSACQRMQGKNKLELIILARDASPRLKEIIHTTPAVYYSTCEELGKRLGRNRIAIIGIFDSQFARTLYEHIPQNDRIKVD